MLGARNWTIFGQESQNHGTKEAILTKASWCQVKLIVKHWHWIYWQDLNKYRHVI